MRVKLLIAFVLAAIATLAAVRAQNPPQADSNTAPSQQQSKAPPATPKEPAPPPSVTVIGARDAHGVLGRDVRSPTDEAMGRIVDVIVDRSGVVRAAVIDFGGFLGVGSRKIAVDWNLLSFDPEKRDRAAVLALRRREIRAAPEYRGDAASAEMVGPPLVGPSSGDAGK
jgi:hypothetical protein